MEYGIQITLEDFGMIWWKAFQTMAASWCEAFLVKYLIKQYPYTSEVP
jgi:hypothetical protein